MSQAVLQTFFNKKLDEFGHGHDEDIIKMMDLEKQKLHETFPLQNNQCVQENED